MHIELFVEEVSAEAALQNLVPKILPDVTFRIFPHQGKRDLLLNLPSRLRGYRRWLPDDYRLVILMDVDTADCHQEKARLEAIAAHAGLRTRTSSGNEFKLLNRLAIEELEAWFFGDIEALREAYPRLPGGLGQKAAYRDPDLIRGGTWEALERELRQAGYYRGGLPKIEVARNVSNEMLPERNRSRSFQVFRNGLLGLIEP